MWKKTGSNERISLDGMRAPLRSDRQMVIETAV
jgi:hypothetical protein